MNTTFKAWKPATTVKTGLVMLLTAATFSIFSLQSCGEKDPVVVTGNIEGTVVEATTSKAIVSVIVDIVAKDNSTFLKQSLRTNSDGKFSITDLEAGTYSLTFTKAGYTTNTKEISVSAGRTATVEIALTTDKNILSVSPQILDFGTVEPEKSVIVLNNGIETVSYEANADKQWITLASNSGSIAAGTSKIIQVSVNRTGLTPGEYTANLVINSNSTSVTVPITLKIVQPSAPEVLIGEASGISSEAAQISANIVSLGSSNVTEHGHCWSTNPNPTTANNRTAFGAATATKSFTSEISGLSPSITYYVKAYAVNNIGITYSDQISFITLAPPTVPTVQTVRTENVK